MMRFSAYVVVIAAGTYFLLHPEWLQGFNWALFGVMLLAMIVPVGGSNDRS
jgi:hypothetical protein